MSDADETLVRAETAARTSYGRLLALLASGTSDLAAAEDALADAFETALRTWPQRGVPGNPDGWLLTVARNKLRDHWKSAAVQRNADSDPEAYLGNVASGRLGGTNTDDIDFDSIGDKRLELMLVCAHPAIDPGVRTPLMLNTVLGFTAAQIADIFAVPAGTMSTRLLRAKRKIKETRIPFLIPARSDLPPRLNAVLEAVYGAYAMEWPGGDEHTGGLDHPRRIPSEALTLAEVVAELIPDDPEVHGLLALIEFSASRAKARLGEGGEYVPLSQQDPRHWDQALIRRARARLRAAYAWRSLGRFQVEAAIQAVHCARADTGQTDWASLRELHEILAALAPGLGSLVALAMAYAETDGAESGLAHLDTLAGRAERFQPAWAARAELLSRLGYGAAAADAYARAIDLTRDEPQRNYLRARMRDQGSR